MPTKVTPPPVQPMKIQTDIQLFAKAYFNIDLTSAQMEMIALIASGKPMGELRFGKQTGKETAKKVVLAYLQAGISAHGRARLPMHALPPREKPAKGVTQEGRILAMIQRPGGAYNFELARFALKYTSVISELRKDGHEIVADRQYLKNGKASNTWRYRMGGQ